MIRIGELRISNLNKVPEWAFRIQISEIFGKEK